MKTSTAKPRLTVSALYSDAADYLAQQGNKNPSHCTVRCLCNDILDAYERDGYTVPHHYSQDKAHREVCAMLRD